MKNIYSRILFLHTLTRGYSISICTTLACKIQRVCVYVLELPIPATFSFVLRSAVLAWQRAADYLTSSPIYGPNWVPSCCGKERETLYDPICIRTHIDKQLTSRGNRPRHCKFIKFVGILLIYTLGLGCQTLNRK